jgi:type II secretory pathway pseudopilin PulG
MQTMFVLVVVGFIATSAGIIWYILRTFKERERAEQERAASFLAATAGRTDRPEAAPAPTPALPASPPLPPAGNGLAVQKLLFESAHKAGEAGEPALALQLYERLLARYPQTAFADQARAGVEAQKRKLSKA